jgi:hypothetical protein
LPDARLIDKLRRDELLSLGSRIRMRLTMEYARSEDLNTCLTHLLDSAGNPTLMSEALKTKLGDHANYRALTTMAGQLLTVAAERNLAQLDKRLCFEIFAAPDPRASGARHALTSKRPMRTKHTFHLPPEITINLAEFAARKRVPQALVVETALASYLSPHSSERPDPPAW